MFFPGWTDIFLFCQSHVVCMKDELSFPNAVTSTGKQQEHTGSQLFWKARPTFGKKPYNTELILVQRTNLLGFENQLFKYPETDHRETAQYKIKTKVVLNAHLDQVL